jgi:nucleoside-diphosphate-sugar epimerase
MKVLVVGASGAIGRYLVPQLVAKGHHVVGTSRTADRHERLKGLGAEPIVLDVFDRGLVRETVLRLEPEAIIHQATALTGVSDFKHFDRSFHITNELRTRGTDALLAAAQEAGVRRFIAQSYAGWPAGRGGSRLKTEDDPLDPEPVAAMQETLNAIKHLERVVTAAGGVVLRYGGLYGAPDDAMLDLVRKRRFPIVGDGGGIWSFVHLEDAAAATVLALDHGAPGVYNIVDDDPAPVSEWLPALAAALGAPPPRRIPRWLGRLAAGESGIALMCEVRGALNEKAKRELGWTLRYPSWRSGFVASYGVAASARAA